MLREFIKFFKSSFLWIMMLVIAAITYCGFAIIREYPATKNHVIISFVGVGVLIAMVTFAKDLYKD